jgi:glycosyltransferase involved in cell wall biosynthesis
MRGRASDTNPRIILFNLYHGGHHPQHLECLLMYWASRNLAGELHVVISQTHAERHPQVPSLVSETPHATLHLASTPRGFGHGPEPVLRRERLHSRLAGRYARLLHADHLFFMYFDHVQLALAVDLRFPWPLQISGVYFRPSFHYGPLGIASRRRRQRMAAWAKQVVLRAALRNPHVRSLFSLDPFAASHIARWAQHTESIFLPEPLWVPGGRVQKWAREQAIEPGRRRLVIFGSLDDRKGIPHVLDALGALPASSQRRLALILAGSVSSSRPDELRARIAALNESSQVQVLLDDRFLPEAEVQPLLAASDLVLLTYQHDHIGSSGGLVRAAAAGVPVLSTDHGLVGVQVRRHRLGLTLDTTSAEEIRSALLRWLERPATMPFDPVASRMFAAANTADAFAETIFTRLLPRQLNRHEDRFGGE